MRFWNLPGPASFAESVIDSLRDGKSVFLASPKTVLQSIDQELYQIAGDVGFRIDRMDFNPSKSPIPFLYQQYEILLNEKERYSLDGLLRKIGNSGKIIFIQNAFYLDKVEEWISFLQRYESLSRSIPAFQRTRFIFVCRGIPEEKIPREDPALAVHRWQGVVSSIDMIAYCGARLLEVGIDPIEAPLVANMVCALSMWDVELADALLQEKTKSLYDPIKFLTNFAELRKWRDLLGGVDGRWHNGVVDRFDGVECTHSAWLSISGYATKVRRLVWGAQAAILLPKIEMHRSALAPTICKRVRFPYVYKNNTYNDVAEVEIGSLAFLAAGDPTLRNKNIAVFARKLQDLRNDLAHLRIVEEHRATDKELLLPYSPQP